MEVILVQELSLPLHTNSNKLLDKTKIKINKTNFTDDRKSAWVLFDFLPKKTKISSTLLSH